jgi:hypothetical protein
MPSGPSWTPPPTIRIKKKRTCGGAGPHPRNLTKCRTDKIYISTKTTGLEADKERKQEEREKGKEKKKEIKCEK